MNNKEKMKELDIKILRDFSELSALIVFLEKTKDGKYAVIEKTSLDYSRLSAETEIVDSEENYYYSLS